LKVRKNYNSYIFIHFLNFLESTKYRIFAENITIPMKQASILSLFALLAICFATSCSDTVTYAEQLAAEKKIIKEYIQRENINVLSKSPKVWGEKDYVLTSNGLYYHLVDSGDTSYEVDTNDVVIPRYLEYTLTLPTDTTTNNTSATQYPFPSTYVYKMSTSALCTAFREAVDSMKYSGSHAILIIPSKIGFYTSSDDVIPYAYDLKLKIQRRNY